MNVRAAFQQQVHHLRVTFQGSLYESGIQFGIGGNTLRA
jgi:hypothetical protein